MSEPAVLFFTPATTQRKYGFRLRRLIPGALASSWLAGADPFLCGVLRGIGGSGEDGEVVGSVGGGVVDR